MTPFLHLSIWVMGNPWDGISSSSMTEDDISLFERYDGLSRYCNISLIQPKINFQHSIGSTYELKSYNFYNYKKSLFLRITYTPRMLLLLSFGALLLWQATAAADVILVVAVVDGPRSSADVGINKHVGTSPHSFPHSQQAREDGRYVRIDR